MRWWIWCAGLALATVLATCTHAPRGTTPPDGGGGVAGCSSDGGPYTNGARLAAMLSVQAHARFGRTFPEGFRPQPLEAAVAFLRADPDPLAGSRRRRAIARLAASRFEEFREEIRRLGGDLAVIEKILRPKDAACQSGSPETEAAISNAHEALSGPACPWTALGTVVTTNELPTTTAWTKVSVRRALKPVAQSLDGQRWDACSKFFSPAERTYMADPGTNATYPVTTGDWAVAHGAPPGVGTSYGVPPAPGWVLFEAFSATDAGFTASFKNLLVVRSQKTSGFYITTYALGTPGRALIADVNGTQFTLTIDEGFAQATRSDSQTIVEAQKRLRFAETLASAGTNALFVTMADELAGEFAEIACCPAQ